MSLVMFFFWQNGHSTATDIITNITNITKYVFLPYNIHTQNNLRISSELSIFSLQAVIGEVQPKVSVSIIEDISITDRQTSALILQHIYVTTSIIDVSEPHAF